MSTHQPRRIDRDTAEHLLAGVPAVRHRVGPLGAYLAAAAAPGQPQELAGGPQAMAAFQAAHLQPAAQQRRTSMIKTWVAKLLTVKAAALLAATAAGGMALAATTGALPNPLADTLSPAHATGRPTTTPSHPGGRPSVMPSASLLGLCHAYTAGAGADHGKALADPAFTDLVTAAGGTAKVTTFCATILASAAANAASHPAGPADTTHPTGPPTSTPANSHPTGAPTEHPTGPPSAHPSH